MLSSLRIPVSKIRSCFVSHALRSLNTSTLDSAPAAASNSSQEEVNFYRQVDYFYDKAAVLIEDKLAKVHFA